MNKVIISSDLKIDENIEKEIKQLILKILKEFKMNNFLIEVFIVGDKLMRELNFKYRKKKKTTEVLSFSEREKKIFFPHPETKLLPLGEIFLNKSVFSVKKVPNEFKSLITINSNWWKYLLIHSVLHLLGYNHKITKDQLLMEKKEKFLLKKILKEQ